VNISARSEIKQTSKAEDRGRQDFVLSEKIKQSAKDKSFEGAIIYGKQRVGKSSYALQTMYDIYGDWNKVLYRIFFKLGDLLDFLKDVHLNKKNVDCILWDDAGVYGSSGLWFSNRRMAEYLQNLMDVVGVRLNGFLLTTPNPENLLKALRSYEFYRIKCVKHNQYYRRMAKGYQSILFPSGKLITPKKFRDYYDVRLPDDVYEEYKEVRESYLDDAMENLEDYIVEEGLKDKDE